jgi:hypothetical protein
MSPRKANKDPIPEFRNYQEEAEFWDTHDTADYMDEFKPVKVKFAKNLSELVTMRLDRNTLNGLKEFGRRKGLGPTTLARMWIMERLWEEQKSRETPRTKKASP